MFRSLFAAICLLLFTTACTTLKEFEDNLSTWMGATEEQLVMSWGPPTSVYEAGDLKYLSWSSAGSMTLPGSSPTYHTNVIGNKAYTTAIGGSAPTTINLNCQTTMVIKGGLVSSWQWKGNNCY